MPKSFATIAVALVVLLFLTGTTAAIENSPPKFRDFQVYTTSSPATGDGRTVAATMRLVNRGRDPLNVRLSLAANERAGFAGKEFAARIEAGKDTTWQFDLTPPQELKYEVLK